MKNLTPAELAVVAAVDRDRITDDLAALVRIPSVTGDESAVQTEAALRMAMAGLEVTRIDADPAELGADPDFPGMEAPRTTLPVVAGTAGVAGSPRRIILCGHVDTVGPGPRDDWTTDPFGAEIRDGKLYGRGALDMKGGVVAALAALRALVETDAELGGEAVLLTVPAEEDGGAGMLAAIRAGYTAEMAVITEPTNGEIVVAHAGAITFRLTLRGRAAHAAFRLQGVSALEKLRVIHDALIADEQARNEAERNPVMQALRLPYPTNLGIVRGGEWASTVPDRITVEGRYGVRLDESPGQAEMALRDAVAAAAEQDEWLRDHPPEVEITGGRFASAQVPHTHVLPWSLGGTARDVLGKLPDFTGMPYGADMRLLVHQGATPTVLYGPGDPLVAHAPDEHIDLEQIARCARVLAVWTMRALAD
ncbi:MAG: acetylornithine deacetylase [Gaiellales bacterium]|jgi:acetylornithine deacetylase|nr:acetylornithine deacetylase [Gaiellales bacterium]